MSHYLFILDCGNSYSKPVDCEYWAMRDECTKNPEWMGVTCQESCRKCPKRILPEIKPSN